MADFSSKTDAQIDSWIRNYEEKQATKSELYPALLLERARRAQGKQKLDFEKSLDCLKQAAIAQKCVSYGDLAAASDVEWSKARHQMNGSNGHLDRLLEICYAKGLPLLTAICVNQQNLATAELGKDALTGFVTGAERLGLNVTDARAFHYKCRDECWEWGKANKPTPQP